MSAVWTHIKEIINNTYRLYCSNKKIKSNYIYVNANDRNQVSSQMNQLLNLLEDKEFGQYKLVYSYEKKYRSVWMSKCQYIISEDLLPDKYLKNSDQTIVYVSSDLLAEEVVRSRRLRSLLISDYIMVSDTQEAEDITDKYKISSFYQGVFLSGDNKEMLTAIFGGNAACKMYSNANRPMDNVLIYNARLAKNGMTTAFLNLISNIDLTKRNYILTFRESVMAEAKQTLNNLPEEITLFPIGNRVNMTVMESLAYFLYFKKNKENGFTRKYLNRLFKRENEMYYGGLEIDFAIQYAGYEGSFIKMFEQFSCPHFIFVHNDMVQEIKTKGNQHYPTLKSAYQNYDKVAVVTEDMITPTQEIAESKADISVVNNVHDYAGIIERAEQPVLFDTYTAANIKVEELKEVLKGKARKYISIGRFSYQKGHMRLIDAFEAYDKRYPGNYLIIIGGYGEMYEETLERANRSTAQIVIIQAVSNPMPILKQCDLFVLSSYYEGLGLAALEADTLGVPVISTDVQGPRGFMQCYNGTLVADNEQGLLEGMLLYEQGKVLPMGVDFVEYNNQAVQQFEALFK